MTAEELLAYRHEPYQQELIAGILHEMEPPGAEHGVIVVKIATSLEVHARTAGLGAVLGGDAGFHLASDPDTVRGPDVSFVAADRVERTGIPRGYWPGAPDLAVEVMSHHDRRPAVAAKALGWLEAGARAVVVVDPPRRIATVYRSADDIRVVTADEPLDLGDVVPGWSPRVVELLV